MYKVCIVVSCVVCVLAHGHDAYAQVHLGPSVGFAYEIQSGDVPVYNGDATCGVFSAGRAFIPSLGIAGGLPTLLSPSLGLQSSLSMNYSNVRFTSPPIEPTRVFDASSNTLVQLEEENRLEQSTWSIGVDALATWKMSELLTVGLGPRFRFNISSVTEQSNNIFGPGDYRQSDGQTKRIVDYGSFLPQKTVTVAPLVRLMATLPMGPRTSFMPSLDISHDVMSRSQDFALTRTSIGLSFTVLFDATSRQPTPPITPPEPPRVPELHAELELYSFDDQGERVSAARIEVYESIYRQYSPLLPAVFFDERKPYLPQRYARGLDPQADPLMTEKFSLDSLRSLRLLDLQHRVLDIIGFRMRRHPQAKLTLVGVVSSDESSSSGVAGMMLSGSRAVAVHRYLNTVWKIDSARVQVTGGRSFMERSNELTPDGRADNRRVEMYADDPRIFAPVLMQDVVREFNPPAIRMKPSFRAEAGVVRWDLIVTQANARVAAYSSDTSAVADTNLAWSIVSNPVDSALAPIVATLTVIDSTNARVEARAEASLTIVKKPRVVDNRIELSGDRERIAYTLIAFDFRSAQLDPANDRALQAIASSVRDEASVTITGYTDRIGGELQNAELAQQRADRVANVLATLIEARNIRNVAIKSVGAGVETARFTNDLPEGRFLSRGVTVVVEQVSEAP